jgi:transcription factor SFP1
VLAQAGGSTRHCPKRRVTLSRPVYYQSSTTVFIVASSTHSSTPPLHYPSGRESSAESSPVSTPNSSRHHSVSQAAHPHPQQQFYQVAPVGYHQPDAKAQDLFSQFTTADEFDSDDILFPNDDADSCPVALFPDATQSSPYPTSQSCVPNDTMPSPPIQIATPRQASNSPPRNQQSNLTSQLRQPQATDDLEMDGIPNNNDFKPRQESVSMLSTTPYGARAIPVTDGMGFRRESHVGLSGSLMGGMSWGGLSMGSFVRDE